MKNGDMIEERIEKTTTKRDLGEENTREKKMSTAQKMVPILIIVSVVLLIALQKVLYLTNKGFMEFLEEG